MNVKKKWKEVIKVKINNNRKDKTRQKKDTEILSEENGVQI